MLEDDRSYFQQRAESEIERAQQAKDPPVVKVHYLLAEGYLGKVALLSADDEQK